jgi:hypothetical protein
MKKNIYWILVPFALQACAEPKFEFRGYTDLSSCTEIIDAELASGATFQGGYASDDLDSLGYVTELSGEIFSEQVQIDITCSATGYIDSIHYISPASDPTETGRIFVHFATELDTLFGAPTQIATEEVLSLRYLCNSPAPFLLDEWKLEKEDADDDEEHEVYLAVTPLAAECLEETAE